MSITSAMRERHTVRAFTGKPIPADIVEAIEKRVAEINARDGLAIKLVLDDDRAFNAALKLVLAKGATNYLVLAGPATPEAEERLGYASSELMLLVQELGLNSWWVGGTYSRGAVAKLVEGATAIGIVVIGYGAEQGKPHRSKTAAQVSSYDGEAPAWFAEGVEAALLAPTALNRQAFAIAGRGDEVAISYRPGAFSQADLGIVKHHFELGAGAGNFRWAQG